MDTVKVELLKSIEGPPRVRSGEILFSTPALADELSAAGSVRKVADDDPRPVRNIRLQKDGEWLSFVFGVDQLSADEFHDMIAGQVREMQSAREEAVSQCY